MAAAHVRPVSIGSLAVVLSTVLMPLTRAPVPALALDCGATLDASSVTASDDATAALQGLLDRPSQDGDPAGGCDTWTLRLAGTFHLDAVLTYRGAPDLDLVGIDRTAPAVLIGDGRRILRVLAPARTVALTDLALQGGSARGADLDGAGGAVAFEEQAGVVSQLRATRVLLRDNVAARGGAVAVDRAILVDVEVDGNTADAGGGLDVFELHATRTTFVDNHATGAPGTGGAVRASGDVTLENVTFSENAAQSGGSVWLAGAATPALRPRLHATYATFASVRSAGPGAHLHAEVLAGGAATVVLRGSVLVGGAALDGGDASVPEVCAGLVTRTLPTDDDDDDPASIDSFASDASCGEGVAVLQHLPTFTVLPARQDRAGVAQDARVHVPTSDRTLIDAVGCDGSWPATDQRGLLRPQPSGGRCDAGAVELATATRTLEPLPPSPPLPSLVRAGEGSSPRRPASTAWRWPRGR